MDYSNHSKNHGGYNDLSIDVGHQMSEHPLLPDRHGHPYHSGIDMHNRCCSGRFWCIQDICGIICAILTCKDYATIFLNYKTWSYRFTFTGFLILYAKFVVYFVILIPAISNHTIYCIFNMIIFLMLSSLAFSSHIRTMLTDPVSFPRLTISFPVLIYGISHLQGAVPRGNATKEMIQQMGLQQGQVIFKCQKCCSIKPERAHHCSVCHRWNNGKRHTINQVHFLSCPFQ